MKYVYYLNREQGGYWFAFQVPSQRVPVEIVNVLWFVVFKMQHPVPFAFTVSQTQFVGQQQNHVIFQSAFVSQNVDIFF